MRRSIRVLIVEDNPDDAELMLRSLRRGGFEVESRRVETMGQAVAALSDEGWDVVLADYTLPSFRGLEVLDFMLDREIDVPFLIVSGTIEAQTALGAMKAGAKDFILKDQMARLVPSLDRELSAAAERHERREAVRLGEALNDINETIHSSLEFGQVMQKVVVRAAQALRCEASALGLRENHEWVIRHAYPELAGEEGVRFLEQEARIGAITSETLVPVVVNDAVNDARVDERLQRAYRIRSVMIAPLSSKGEVFGGLFFSYHERRHEFTAPEVDFAEKLAANVSLALVNSRLHEEQRRATRLSEVLNAVNEVLLSTLDPGEMLERVVVRAAESAESDKALLFELDDDAWVLTHPSGSSPDRNPVTEAKGLTLAARQRTPLLVDDVRTDERINAEWAMRHAAESYIMVPMLVEGDVAAMLLLTYRRASSFDDRDRRFAVQLSNSLSLALGNARRYAKEHRIAETLQEALLAPPESMPGVEIATFYGSATEHARVGGDFYDAFEVADGRIALVIGDVSGKGLDAAWVTALVKNAIRTHAVEGVNPCELLEKTNNVVYRFTDAATFVTVFFALLDDSGGLVYSNAGHPAPILTRPSGESSPLEGASPFLGAFADIPYDEFTETLVEGSALFAFTDGLIEARGDGGGLYGDERLLSVLREHAGESPREIIDACMRDVRAYSGGTLSDDIAMMAIARIPAPGEGEAVGVTGPGRNRDTHDTGRGPDDAKA